MSEKTNENKKTTENKKLNEKQKQLIYRVLFVVFALVFLISMGIMIRDWYVQWEAEKQFEDLSSMTQDSEDESDKTSESETASESDTNTETESESESETEIDELAALGITVPEKDLNWEELYETNEHIYAWIYIPGTKVDYPILQHPTEDTYYLNRNLNGKKGYPGCVYSETVTSKDFSDYNTLLYAHNMGNKTMFGSLHYFEDAQFFDEYRYVYIYTPETVLVYEIFAAYMYTDDHIYYNFDFGVAEGYQDYIDEIFSIRDMKANIRRDTEVTTDTPMLTMCTCMSKTLRENRYVVNAVLVNKSALKDITPDED